MTYAFLNATVPKLLIGSWAHCPDELHSDGASTIHSAEETSGVRIVRVFSNVVPRVRSISAIVTCVPVTVTAASIWSPGRTVMLIVLPAAGTSSYQAE